MVEGTTFGWVVLVGKDYAGTTCMFTRETSDYEKLYSLDVLGVEDRGEDGQLDACSEFRENIVTRSDGRHEVGVPGFWVPSCPMQTRWQVGNASRTPSENLEELKTSKSSTRR